MEANREYKDSVFRTLFLPPEKALRLYCDITGKTYDKDAVVEMKTLDNALMSKLRNDLAFIINDTLIVILEHQSTLNKNMPLRSLQYVLMFYEIYFKLGNALYKTKLIKLPKPEFYMLYNGQDPYPPRDVMRLSEAFLNLEADEQPGLELIVNVININYGENMEVLEKNAELKGYSILVKKIRERQREGKTLKEAIQIAVEECLAKGILTEFLERHRNEVDAMFSLVYDEEKAIRIAKEEGWEDGLAEGLEKGIEKGREEGREEGIGITLLILDELKAQIPAQEISIKYNLSLEQIGRIQSSLGL